MISTLRKNLRPVVAIVVLVVLALVVGGAIMVNQRVALPGQKTYVVRAEFASAQAVVSSQGQQVTVAGVPVGEITGVQLTRRGTAVLKMKLKRSKLPAVYRDATMALRPRTGLQDMTVDLQPGRRASGELADGATVPIRQTTPQVQIDEVLNVVDADTRAYLQQFLAATDRGLGTSSKQVQDLLALAVPTAKKTDQVLSVLNDRRRLVASAVTRVGRISKALGDRDGDLVSFIDGAGTTFGAVGRHDADVRAALGELPGTLTAARTTLGRASELATTLRTGSSALTPAVRATRRALPRTEPLLRDLRRTLRPVQRLTRVGVRPVNELGSIVDTVKGLTPSARTVGVNAQYLVNTLGYNPEGREEGYMFWLPWLLHNANSLISSQDAATSSWRASLLVSCSSFAATSVTQPVGQILDGLGVCR